MTSDFATAARLLVVEDDASIAELLSESLTFHGFSVTMCTDGQDARRVALRDRPDAMIVDVMLPGLSGFDLVKSLRADGSRIPVLFLTARDAVEDRVTGLTIGGDDYVTKPFSLAEVVARLRNVLRRTHSMPEPEASVLTYADIVMDEDAHEVRRAGRIIELSPTEFRVLRYLMANAERVVSKAELLDNVWHYDFGGDANVVESYVSYLRKKIDNQGVKLLHTVRGVGYVLRIRP